MKTIKIAVVVAGLLLSGLALAEVPERLVYTGSLSDDGAPYEGSVDMVFTIYDAASGGNAVWSESHEGVAVSAGKLSVELGLGADKLSDVFDGGRYFLEVSVGGAPMLPRVPVASVPYAFKALDADTLGGQSSDDLLARLEALESNYEALQQDFTDLEQQVGNVSWNDLTDIPEGFADGVDNEAVAGSVNWTNISNRPAGLDDGDDVGLQSVSWADIQNIPAGNSFTFSGLNVYVNSGAGTTDAAVNGTGNLIIGYDEPRASGSDKSGSHNLVVGAEHNYTDHSGIVSGLANSLPRHDPVGLTA